MNGPAEQALLGFLSRFTALNNEEVKQIAAAMTVRLYKKGTMLLKEGTVSNTCYFVLKGCVRQFANVGGVEKTTAFFLENEAIVLFSSYAGRSPTTQSLICLEETVLLTGATGEEQEMYRKFPKLEMITRQMMELDFGKTQDELNRFMTSSPEQRYLAILERRPELIQRVPQHLLASYIGVTPESLSRIKKRIRLK